MSILCSKALANSQQSLQSYNLIMGLTPRPLWTMLKQLQNWSGMASLTQLDQRSKGNFQTYTGSQPPPPFLFLTVDDNNFKCFSNLTKKVKGNISNINEATHPLPFLLRRQQPSFPFPRSLLHSSAHSQSVCSLSSSCVFSFCPSVQVLLQLPLIC